LPAVDLPLQGLADEPLRLSGTRRRRSEMAAGAHRRFTNRPTCKRNGRRNIPAQRRETTDAVRDKDHQAVRTSILAWRAGMVRRRGVRAVRTLFGGSRRQMPTAHGGGVLRATAQSPLLPTEPLLLKAPEDGLYLWPVTLSRPLEPLNKSAVSRMLSSLHSRSEPCEESLYLQCFC